MGKTKAKDILRAVLIGVLVIIAVLAGGAAMSLNSLTLTEPWIPICICAVLAAASGLTLHKIWRPLTRSNNFAANFFVHFIFTTLILSGSFYVINYTCVDFSGKPNEEVEVIRKYREKHYRSRRIGRNRYVRGEPYWEYKIEVKLPDGKTKKETVNIERYNRIRSGGTLPVEITQGALGVPVMKLL